MTASAAAPRAKKIANAIWQEPFSIGPLKRRATLGAIVAKLLEVIWKIV